MKCKFCGQGCQKAGRQKNGKQRHYCKVCNKYQQCGYKNTACKNPNTDPLKRLLCEGVGIRGISRVLGIALNKVLAQIRKIAGNITKPPIPMNAQSVEMDELRTYIGMKHRLFWIAYAYCPVTPCTGLYRWQAHKAQFKYRGGQPFGVGHPNNPY